MLVLGPIGFTAPWLLLGLVLLPILWFLLRAVPPAPIRRRFPGVALLLGLEDEDNETDKTPWWLLLLRVLAIAAVITGFAGPVLNPDVEEEAGSGPLLVLVDGTWADARDWTRRMERLDGLLSEASRSGRPVAMVVLTDLPQGTLQFQPAEAALARLPSLAPAPWVPEAETILSWWDELDLSGVETFWMSDGLAHDWRAPLLERVEDAGALTVFESPRQILALRPARFEDGTLIVSGTRAAAGDATEAAVIGHGLDPAGTPRALVRGTLSFAEGEREAEIALSLPPELRNRITRFEIDGVRSAGAVSLADDTLRRREVALVAGREDREGLELLSPTHYLEQALEPTADLIEGAIDEIVLANPDAIILADVARLSSNESEALLTWVKEGGLLVRFAGPRLAASDISRDVEDALMPVRLRAGGRSIGGRMSWGEPKALRVFPEESPFFGLPVNDEVRITAQVMAQPDPSLADRTIASLADGTPLVTRKRVVSGQVVLFHTTANAEWSSLPLSGLFVQMLERLAVSTRPATPTEEEMAGTTWVPSEVLTGFGEVVDAGTLPGVPGERLVSARPGPDLQPGLYAGEDRRLALNVIDQEAQIEAATWPADTRIEGLDGPRETPLKGLFLSAALLALMADILATLWLGGRLGRISQGAARNAAAAVTLILAVPLAAPPLAAQEAPPGDGDGFAITATTEVVLAHVITGDPSLDQMAAAGLRGLGEVLYARTSIEPAVPIAVNLETDELSFFPILYWPVSATQPIPSDEAYAKLNTYLRSGGMIVFDTRDADVARFGGTTSPASRRLQQIARPLDIPPLEPVPDDHVLTRTFYLLQDFPGRHISRDVWVEAAPADAERVEGMPFRNLNDNVTPIVIGGNDWAAAWATDQNGRPMYPVGRGFTGERQREIAYRFGVNLVMHVLTGNYKSDQVHVPALLDRLGQ
ncbi:DUF4159 domain-containing protein [Ovoidimarina sediminis]|uniref:DUF4159 domain-containing protein n=1 Tax=Ovoidimarina sediminis TaxID=3079856 RepID=UPI0029159833|nr:DUF4159 domain-containing protein [Rhodophyticola sp. MJ-SS7]MDU8943689.1 DUF4159 domain-containing protein [Rhodophyticola sp. MJ-SS7]